MLVGGIVQNVYKHIPVIFSFLESLKTIFPDLQVCIYENNSTDWTKKGLLERKVEYIDILCEDYEDSFFLNFPARTYDNKPCRIHKIACARNRLLKMIEKYSAEFVMFIDFDFNIAPNPNAILFAINNFPKEADVLFANGIGKNGHYYDGYSLRTTTHPYGPEILGEEFWSDNHMQHLQPKIDPYSNPISVVSAFGGLAIYRAKAIAGCFYSAEVTDELHEFYSKYSIQPTVQTHSNGCSLGVYLKDMKIFYRNNSGYNFPIVAEHVSFNLMVRKKGFDKMFICPFLYYYWN